MAVLTVLADAAWIFIQILAMLGTIGALAAFCAAGVFRIADKLGWSHDAKVGTAVTAGTVVAVAALWSAAVVASGRPRAASSLPGREVVAPSGAVGLTKEKT